VQVIRVNPGSPAEQAGIKPGDMVLAVDGNRVDSLEGFYKKLWDRPGTAVDVELTVLQGADVRKLILKAVDRMSTMVKPAGI
jgi:S1-C subfamily serine protease